MTPEPLPSENERIAWAIVSARWEEGVFVLERRIKEALDQKDAEIAALQKVDDVHVRGIIYKDKQVEALQSRNRELEEEIARLRQELATEQRHWIEDDRDLNELLEKNANLQTKLSKAREALEYAAMMRHFNASAEKVANQAMDCLDAIAKRAKEAIKALSEGETQ